MDKIKINEQLENKIDEILDEGIQVENINMLGKLVDIHKDLANEEYWCKKEEVMNMNYRRGNGGYGNYSRGDYGARGRDSRGRYTRGRMTDYRGYDPMDEMQEHYGNYMANREEMDMGNYGAENGVMKSLEYMLQAAVEFVEKLKEDAGSQEEMELIRKYTRKMSEI